MKPTLASPFSSSLFSSKEKVLALKAQKKSTNIYVFLLLPSISLSPLQTDTLLLYPSLLDISPLTSSLSPFSLTLLSLPSHLFTHAHAPDSFPLISLTRPYYPLSLETNRNPLRSPLLTSRRGSVKRDSLNTPSFRGAH
ncbi:hypothetical protein ILYODFUR_011954 [Ilyodon furcidens]|uniref:Uncharacterized protein n=1 Tax=Ilyodon furcidens TaxID=33524 RepID=A0ABV0T7A7_9TELE